MTELDSCPIDPAAYATLEDVADGDNEFIIELLSQYLQDSALLCEALAPALAAVEGVALERAAHTLKSASANVGAMVLSNLCEDLQCIGRGGDLSEAVVKVPAAEAELARVKIELENRVTKLQGQG